MIIRFLCNAGLAIEHNGKTLMVDLPNADIAPFYTLPDNVWEDICDHEVPYSNISGFFFTHEHADHMDEYRLQRYINAHPDTCVFVPDQTVSSGVVEFDEFRVEYVRFDHAPLPEVPPHVVAFISAGQKTIYVSADSDLNFERHKQLLLSRKVDVSIWTSMYLSRENTRKLFELSANNYINHMPLKPKGMEMWKKCERNMERYASELKNVVVIDRYPSEFTI